MEKGFGISALIIAFLAIVIPVVGPWLTFIVALLVVFSPREGFAFAIAAIVVSVINLLFLSPSFWIFWHAPNSTTIIIPILWIVAQIAGLAFLIKRNTNVPIKG